MSEAHVLEARDDLEATLEPDVAADDTQAAEEEALAESLIEDVSIDGMCGVY